MHDLTRKNLWFHTLCTRQQNARQRVASEHAWDNDDQHLAIAPMKFSVFVNGIMMLLMCCVQAHDVLKSVDLFIQLTRLPLVCASWTPLSDWLADSIHSCTSDSRCLQANAAQTSTNWQIATIIAPIVISIMMSMQIHGAAAAAATYVLGPVTAAYICPVKLQACVGNWSICQS